MIVLPELIIFLICSRSNNFPVLSSTGPGRQEKSKPQETRAQHHLFVFGFLHGRIMSAVTLGGSVVNGGARPARKIHTSLYQPALPRSAPKVNAHNQKAAVGRQEVHLNTPLRNRVDTAVSRATALSAGTGNADTYGYPVLSSTGPGEREKSEPQGTRAQHHLFVLAFCMTGSCPR